MLDQCLTQALHPRCVLSSALVQSATLDALEAGLALLGTHAAVPDARAGVAKALVASDGALLHRLAASAATPGRELLAARAFACAMRALGPEVVSDTWQPSGGPAQPRALANALLGVASHTFVARSDAVRSATHAGWRAFITSLGAADKLRAPKRLAMVLQPVLAELGHGPKGHRPSATSTAQALTTWSELLAALNASTASVLAVMLPEAVLPVLRCVLLPPAEGGGRGVDASVVHSALSAAAAALAQAASGSAQPSTEMGACGEELCSLLRRVPAAVWSHAAAAPDDVYTGAVQFALLPLTWMAGTAQAGAKSPAPAALPVPWLATWKALAATDAPPSGAAILLRAAARALPTRLLAAPASGSASLAAALLSCCGACARRLDSTPAAAAEPPCSTLCDAATLLAAVRGTGQHQPGSGVIEAVGQLVDGAFGADATAALDGSLGAQGTGGWTPASELAVVCVCTLAQEAQGTGNIKVLDLCERTTLAVDNAARGAHAMRLDGSQESGVPGDPSASQMAEGTLRAARAAGQRLRSAMATSHHAAAATTPAPAAPTAAITPLTAAPSPRSLFAMAVTHAATEKPGAAFPIAPPHGAAAAVPPPPHFGGVAKPAAGGAARGRAGAGMQTGGKVPLRRPARRDEDSNSQYVRIEPGGQPSQPPVLTDHQREVRDAQRAGGAGVGATYTALDPSASQDATQSQVPRTAVAVLAAARAAAVAPTSFAGILAAAAGPTTAVEAQPPGPPPPPPPAAAAAAAATVGPPAANEPTRRSAKRVRFTTSATAHEEAQKGGRAPADPEQAAREAMPPPFSGVATQEGAAALHDMAVVSASAPLCPALAASGHPACSVPLDKILGRLPTQGLAHLVAGTGCTSLGQLAALPNSSVAAWPRDGAAVLRRCLEDMAHTMPAMTTPQTAVTPADNMTSRKRASIEESPAATIAPSTARKPSSRGHGSVKNAPRASALSPITPGPTAPGSLLAQELARLEASPLWGQLDQALQRSASGSGGGTGAMTSPADAALDAAPLVAAQGKLLGLASRVNSFLGQVNEQQRNSN